MAPVNPRRTTAVSALSVGRPGGWPFGACASPWLRRRRRLRQRMVELMSRPASGGRCRCRAFALPFGVPGAVRRAGPVSVAGVGDCARPSIKPAGRRVLRRVRLAVNHRQAVPRSRLRQSEASRSGPSGSPTVPCSRSSGPCANRVCNGATGGSRPATSRSPARTSSGRTDGVPWRTTNSSIAHNWSPTCPDAAERLTTAVRQSKDRRPFLVIRSTWMESAARNDRTADPASAGSTPGSAIRHDPASSRSANACPGLAGTTSTTSSPSGSAASRRCLISAGSQASRSPISRYSASLAAPVGEAPAYEMRGCGEKPEEYATGIPARRMARSKARPKSR
jgi:hypothetical protein